MVDACDDLSGQVVDSRYRVERCIGRGGMGVVWRARHVRTGQLFALKTLHGVGLLEHKALRRVLHEARATAAVQSRHVVRVVDVEPEYLHEGNALPFIVMELLHGMSLAEWLDIAHRTDLAQLLWIIQQIVRGLSAVHRSGIVHRDLKPSNVFIAREEDGETVIKLCDFGIAKLQQHAILDVSESGLMSTETGAVFGTPRYMAPEQLRHHAKQGPATDQWALALIAFRALTGANYFDHVHGAAELILAIVHEPMPVPSGVSPDWPRALDDWFLRSCARNPSDRFDDVDRQLADLESGIGAAEASPIRLPPNALGSNRPPHPPDGTLGSNSNRQLDCSVIARIIRNRRLVPAYYGLLAASFAGSLVAIHWLARIWEQESTTVSRVLPQVLPTQSRPTSKARLDVTAAARPPELNVGPSATTVTTANTVPASPATQRDKSSFAMPKHSVKVLTTAQSLPRGATCNRSAECAEGLCAAEVCQ